MSKTYKVIVTGPFNSGKTLFIKTVSDIDVVTTERRITTEDRGIKSETTVAMDYGRVKIDDTVLHLNGTPGQTRFNFMWEILATEMNGFILLVDSADPASFPDAAELIELFSNIQDVPYIIAANKADLPEAVKVSKVQRALAPEGNVTVMPCISTQRSSVRQVLRQMIQLMEKA